MESNSYFWLMVGLLLAISLDLLYICVWRKSAKARGLQNERIAPIHLFVQWLKDRLSRFQNSGLARMSMLIGMLSVWGAQWLRWNRPVNSLTQTGYLALLAIGLVILIVVVRSPTADRSDIESTKPPAAWQLGCLGLGVVISMVISFSTGSHNQQSGMTAMGWFATILLVGIGGLTLPLQKINIKWNNWLVFEVVLITGAAFALRACNVSQFPYVLTGDEGSSGLMSVNVLEGRLTNPFRTGWYGFPAAFFFLQAPFVAVWGRTTEALRWFSSLGGALTVGATYLVAYSLLGKHVARYSAIFLAVLHIHLNFSRIGLNNIWDGLWAVLALGLLVYGWKHENRNAFLVSGFAAGFAQYFYASSRLIVFVGVTWLFLIGLSDFKRIKRLVPALGLLLLAFWVVAMPLVLLSMGESDEYLAPIHRTGVLNFVGGRILVPDNRSVGELLIDQLKIGVGVFLANPLTNWYKPERAILLLPGSAFFCLGFTSTLRRIKDALAQMMLIWLGGFIVMISLTFEPSSAQRMMIGAPVIAIMVGIGISDFATYLGSNVLKFPKMTIVMGLAVVMLVSVNELWFYFRVYSPKSDLGGRNTWAAQQVADYLLNRVDNAEVVFFGAPSMGYQSIPSLEFLFPGLKGINIEEPWGNSENPVPTDTQLLFVFLPHRIDEIYDVVEYYPGGRAIRKTDGQRKYEVWFYDVSTSP